MDVIELLRKRIEEYEAQLSAHLLGGGASTHEEYMHLVGKGRAFRILKQDLEEIERRYIED
jgi:hypothetical protein